MAWVMTGIAVANVGMSIYGGKKAKKAERERARRNKIAKEFEAQQLDQQAGQSIAISQRAASRERRNAQVIASRALALAAASGGGASDSSVNILLADIDNEGAYRASMALYQGEENARRLRMSASSKRYEGEAGIEGAESRADAINLQTAASGLDALSSLYGKYSGGGPNSTDTETDYA